MALLPQARYTEAEKATQNNDFEPVPPGDYLAVCERSDYGPTKSGYGNALALTFVILDGGSENRKVFAHLNLEFSNPSNSAEKNRTVEIIAERQLDELTAAIGAGRLSDSSELEGRQVVLTLRVKAASGGFKAKNEVARFSPASDWRGGSPAPVAAPKAVQRLVPNIAAPIAALPWAT